MAKRKPPLRPRSSKNRSSSRAPNKNFARAFADNRSSSALLRKSLPSHPENPNRLRIAQPQIQEPLRRRSSTDVSAWLSSTRSSRALMDLAHDAILIRNPQSIIESWNAGAHELYGWSPSEAIGRISHELLDTNFPVSLDSINKVLSGSGYWEGELHHRRKDGKRITVLSRWSLLRNANGNPLLVKEINRDITQEQRQLGYLRLLSEVGRTLIEAQSISEALGRSLASISLHTRWCMARALSFSGAGSLQQPDTLFWHVSDEPRLGPAREALEQKRRRIGEAPLAARAIESNKPVWIEDLALDPYFKNVPELAQAGLISAFAQPVIASGTQAALLLFSDMPLGIDEPFLSAMHSLAAHLCRFFERLTAEEAHRRLSATLLRAQDDERRRIARELHDSAGQYLGALGLSIEAVRHVLPKDARATAEEKLAEAEDIISRCSSDLRTLSYLLHPPLIEDLGLASAVNWYISGFVGRSGIEVNAKIGKLPRFSDSVELTLFRILQESLTNIHRHSNSKSADVALSTEARSVTLEIRDQGKGIPQETLLGWSRNTHRAGIGINGMRERVNDLGGSFEITSDKNGTTLRASIPLRAASSALADGALTDGAPASVTFTLQDPVGTDAAQTKRKKTENGFAQEQADAGGNGPKIPSAALRKI